MAGQAPKDTLSIAEQNEQIERRRREWLVGLVDPSGGVVEVSVGPDKDRVNGHRHGVDIVYYAEGRVTMTEYGERVGWTMLEQRCKEDGVPQMYQAWKDTVIARMDGHPIVFPKLPDGSDDMSAIYPPSVLAQRKAGPRAAGKPRAFIPGQGLVELDEVSADDRADRIAKLGGQLGAFDPKEIDEGKKGRRHA